MRSLERTVEVEEAWPRVLALFERPEAVSLEAMLLEVFDLPWTDPRTAEVRAALTARLRQEGALVEVNPGYWLNADRVPAPPSSTRLPTVRIDNGSPILVEAHQAWHEIRADEGLRGFTQRLCFRDIQLGFLRLSKHAAALYPEQGPSRIRLSFERTERTAWFTRKPYPMLYGLEDWIWVHEPGEYVRFERVEPGHFAVKKLDKVDEVFYRSESRLFDLNTLQALRRFGLSYREHVRLLLAGHPEGLAVREILDALEVELAFRPHPPTIRGLLSAGSEFRSERGRWRLALEGADAPWGEDYRQAAEWFAEDGADIQSRATYRALIMTVGGSLEPLAYSLCHSRPEGVCFIVSEATAGLIPQLRESLAVPVEWEVLEVVDDHQDLNACLISARRALARILAHGLAPSEVLVDITGGTKVMSAAAALATHGSGCAFSYVGGTERTKNNTGIVLSGTELRLITQPLARPQP